MPVSLKKSLQVGEFVDPVEYMQKGWLPKCGHLLSDIEPKEEGWKPYLKLELDSDCQIEARASWSCGGRAVVVLPVPLNKKGRYFIKMLLGAYLAKENGYVQLVNVFVKGQKICAWIIDSQIPHPKLLVVPEHLLIGDDELFITLETSNAVLSKSVCDGVPKNQVLGVELYSMIVFDDLTSYLADLQKKYADVCTYRDELIEMEGRELKDRGELVDIASNVMAAFENIKGDYEPIKKKLSEFLANPYLYSQCEEKILFDERYFYSKLDKLRDGKVEHEIEKWRAGLYSFKEAVLDAGNYAFRQLSIEDVESYELLNDFLNNNKYPAEKLKKLKDKNERLNNLEILLQKSEIDSVPPFLEIEMTSFCNFRCVMCSRSMMKFLHNQQNDRQILQISRILPYVKHVTIAGVGEPCLSNKLNLLSKALDVFDCSTLMFTNGSLLHKQLEAVSRFAVVNISFDGPNKEIFGAQRRHSNFETIVNNIRKLREESPDGILAFSVVVSRINVDEIAAIVRLAGELGVNSVNLSPLVNVSLLELKESDQGIYEEQLKMAQDIAKKYNVTVNNNVHADTFSSENDTPRDKAGLVTYFGGLGVPADHSHNLQNVVRKLEENDFNYYPDKSVFYDGKWPLAEGQCEVFSNDSTDILSFEFDMDSEIMNLDSKIASLENEVRNKADDWFKLPYCLAVWKYAYVKSNGKSRLCPHRNVDVGNYREYALGDVLNYPVIKDYRASMLNAGGVSNMCRECGDHHRTWSIDSLRATSAELGLNIDDFEKIV